MITNSAYSQNRANVWVLGQQFAIMDCGVDFNSGISDTFAVWKDLEFLVTNSSICDTSGQLLFYSNGIYIANKNHDSLKNCKNFNPGFASDNSGDYGLSAPQGAISIPKPANSNNYSLFHISGEELDNGAETQPLHLRYTEIDMFDDNGLGSIIIEE